MTHHVESSSAPPVGFVGLGAMGIPMSRAMLEQGLRVLGHDPEQSSVARFVANGGVAAGSAGALVDQVDVVVTSLPGVGAVRSVLDELGAAGSAARSTPLVVVDTSTLALSDRHRARAWAEQHAIVLLDCPVSGTSAQAQVGDLVAFLSGDDGDHLARARPVVEAMTRATHLVGPFGNGTKMKLVANLLVAVHNLAAAEALLLAQRSGLDLDLVLEAVGSGAGGSRMLSVRGPLMVAESFDDATVRVEIFQKDLRAIQELAVELSSPVPLLAASVVFYEMAMAQGRSQQDTACLFGVLKRSLEPIHTPLS